MKYVPLPPDPVGIWFPMLCAKETPSDMPVKYPKKSKDGPAMDYSDSRLAFPKSGKKQKKGKK